MLAAISSCWAWGERHGLLPEGHANPAAKIARFREEGRERFLSSGELARLGEALAQREIRFGPHASAAIRLLCLTGARLSEILALRWREVDFERGLALLSDSKTGRKPVYLGAAALAILASQTAGGARTLRSHGASLGLPVIGKLLGHTQAATTQRYAHLGADPVRRAAETIGATISAAMDNRSTNVTPIARTR
jgi:integrase